MILKWISAVLLLYYHGGSQHMVLSETVPSDRTSSCSTFLWMEIMETSV